MKKYELTEYMKMRDGRKLFRIRALRTAGNPDKYQNRDDVWGISDKIVYLTGTGKTSIIIVMRST